MSKVTEANLYVKKAEKCMKTSLLKWSTDTEGAIANYTKAAECFKDANDLTSSIDLYKKIADMYLQSDSLFYCAKTLEEAANLYRERKDYKNMSELILMAGDKLRVNGNSDSACQLMKRVAKSIEDDEPKEAAKLYMFACDSAQDKDSIRDAGEFAGLASKLFVRVNDFENALIALKSKADLLSHAGVYHEAGKGVVCQVLIHMYNNDFVAAEKAYSNCIEQNSFGSSDDSSPVNQLLCACEQKDFDEARRLLKSPTFMYLENDFVRLARDIKFPEYVSKNKDNVLQPDIASGDVIDEDIN